MFPSIRKTLLERKARVKFSRPDDYVFGTSVGTATDPGNFAKRELHAAITAANKSRKEKELPALEPFTWHSLRHHAVSALISQGAAITLVARIARPLRPSRDAQGLLAPSGRHARGRSYPVRPAPGREGRVKPGNSASRYGRLRMSWLQFFRSTIFSPT